MLRTLNGLRSFTSCLYDLLLPFLIILPHKLLALVNKKSDRQLRNSSWETGEMTAFPFTVLDLLKNKFRREAREKLDPNSVEP